MIPAVGCGALSMVARTSKAQRIINALPYPQALPASEVFVDTLPRGEIFRQATPGTPFVVEVKNGI